MRTIKQGKTDGHCMAACAAMLCNTSIEDFVKVIGPATRVCGNPKAKILGYRDYDLQHYLLMHDKSFDIVSIPRKSIDLRKKGTTLRRLYHYKSLPGYLTVKSERYKGVLHAVIWDNKAQYVRDPNPLVSDCRKLNEYEIVYWTPVFNI